VASSGSFRINRAGIAELLESDSGIRGVIEEATAAAAETAQANFPDGFLVLNGVVITDRPQGNVTVVNRSAEAIEGKYGYLARSVPAGFEPLRKGK
jgi:hypothetical protein